MKTNIDLTDPEGPSIEPSIILTFLIKRFNEVLASEHPKAPAVLLGLGLGALASDTQFFDKYRKIISYSFSKKEETLRSSIEIFQCALDHDLDRRSSQNPPQAEECREMGEKFCRQVMMRAILEGQQMLEEGDFRFVRIFECLAWIALQCDQERLAEFDEIRTSYNDDPEKVVRRGTDILRNALFPRRPTGRVQPSALG